MIDLAINHKDALLERTRSTAFDPKYDFLAYSTYTDYDVTIDDSSWSKYQLVSIANDGSVIGYIHFSVSRMSTVIQNVQIMSYASTKHERLTFLHDCTDAIIRMIDVGFTKMEFEVVLDNHTAVNLYDRLVSATGGSVVGIRRNSVRTRRHLDKLYDLKLYDIHLQTNDCINQLTAIRAKLSLLIEYAAQ